MKSETFGIWRNCHCTFTTCISICVCLFYARRVYVTGLQPFSTIAPFRG